MEKQDCTVVVGWGGANFNCFNKTAFFLKLWINLLILFSINPWIVVFVEILRIVRNASQIAQSDTFTMFSFIQPIEHNQND